MPISAGAYAMERAYEGQIASNQLYTYIKGTFEEVINGQTTTLPFGRFVIAKVGGVAGEITLPSAASQVILGVTPFADRFERNEDGSTGYPAKQAAAYVQKGIIFMVAETALTKGGTVFVRHTANPSPGTYDAIGRVRNNADTARAGSLAGAYILETVAAGALVPIELDLPPLGTAMA